MTFDRESAVMRKRITPWLVFLLAVFVPTFISVGYAAEAYRKESQRANESVEAGRVELADELTRDLDAQMHRAKQVVASIPKDTHSLADAMRIVLAAMPEYAELVSLDRGGPSPGQISSDTPGVRDSWFQTVFTRQDETRVMFGSEGADIIVLRELPDWHRVGYAFTVASVEREIGKRVAWRGYALERTQEVVEADSEAAKRLHALDSKLARFREPGQIKLNPRAVWSVVVRDRELIIARELRAARSIYWMRLGATGAFLLITFVLFVRGQRQKRLAELRTDYVAAVSHELRTPLASVRMFSELLEAEAIPADERREVELSLANEARRLHGTLERMLRFGALSRGKLGAERATAALRPILDAAAARGGSRFAVEADAALEASVDAGLLGHALDNLVGNANKYAPEGPVVLRASREGKDLVVEVVDQGPGLDRAARRKIWRPFERAEDRLSKATQGTGVGLALVDGIARAHGGRASVTSRPGAGSTFRLRFPQKG